MGRVRGARLASAGLAAYVQRMKLHALGIALVLALGCAHGITPQQVADQQAKAAKVGTKAPDGSLTLSTGTKVALADVLREHAQNVVVFYRGFY